MSARGDEQPAAVTPPTTAAAAAVAVPAASTAAAATTDLDASRNRLAVPGLVGDPFTSFDVDEQAGCLVTGTASGSVCLWRLDHVSELMLGAGTAATASHAAPSAPAPPAPISTDGLVCRVMATSSDEGAKHVFLRDQQVFAVIGDVHVKIWGNWHDLTFLTKRFDRAHEYKSCKESFTLRHEMKILVVTTGTNEGVLLNMDTMQQTQFKLSIPSHSTPVFFDGTYLIVVQIMDGGLKLAQVYEVQTERLLKSLVFDKTLNSFYWGFQLFASKPASAHPSLSSSASAPSPPSTPSSSSPLLSYISCHNVVKCVPLSAIQDGLSLANLREGMPADRARTRDLITHRIVAARSGVRIIAYMHDEANQSVITLNSDGKIKVFALDSAAGGSRPSAGRLLRKYRHCAGTFKLGYPYILKKIGERLLFYSADEGIFVMQLD